MIINKETLRTMDYINDASYRTIPQPDSISKDYQRDKEYFSLDYFDMTYRKVYLTEDEFQRK